METKISYLEQLEHDLVRAAERERHLEPDPPAPVHPHGRRRWIGIVAAAAAFLAVAGVIGGLTKLSSNSNSAAITGASSDLKAVNGLRQGVPTHGQASQPFAAASPSPAPASGPQHGAGTSAGQESSTINLSKIIRTGSMSVTVPRAGLGKAVDEVTAIADRHGGFVFSSSIATRSGLLVLHVPARRFDAVMTSLRAIGVVKGVSVSSQDVTSQFIDLSARLKILDGRRRVLQGLYSKANSIEQSLRVLTALEQTQQNIEQIQGQLNVIKARTSESTIRIQLREAGVANVTTQTPVHTPSIGNAWDHAVAGFVGVIAAVVIGLGYLIPLAILALFVSLAVMLVRRRRATS
jgi:Domain of unknown function (DUF4349)